jgi:DNA-binding NarL/FixJ family response regulator
MRLVIADDSVLIREGTARLLTDSGFTVLATARDGAELTYAVRLHEPDVAIIDIRMPPTHTDEGLTAAIDIHTRHPCVGVLLLSQYIQPDYALALLDSSERGVGYLLKDRILDTRQLTDALRRISQGESVIDPQLTTRLLQHAALTHRVAELTPREHEVLALMAEGLSDHGIAARLHLTDRTVETHISHIMRKLDLRKGATTNRRVHAVLTYLQATPTADVASRS